MNQTSTPSTHAVDWFGPHFDDLHPQLQALHREGGTLVGPMQLILPQKGWRRWLSVQLAQGLGMPDDDSREHEMRVTIFSDDQGLHWYRQFNQSRGFRSIFKPHGKYPGGYWTEAIGPMYLRLGVEIVDGGWKWIPQGVQWKFIRCPQWLIGLMAQASKRITDDGYYQFEVVIGLLGLPRLLTYRGRLQLQPKVQTERS